MKSSNHPASEVYFSNDPKLGVELTEEGEVVFGKIVTKYSSQLQESSLREAMAKRAESSLWSLR